MVIKRSYLLLVSLLLSSFISVWIIKIKIPAIDLKVSQYAQKLADTPIYSIAFNMTHLGSKVFLIPFTIVMGILLWIRFRSIAPSIVFAGGTLLSHLLNSMIKQLIKRERPSQLLEASASGYSFPSGHAMTATVCYGLLLYFLSKKITSKSLKRGFQLFIVGLIFCIGASRVIINVHYLTDVVAGFLIGMILLLIIISGYEKY